MNSSATSLRLNITSDPANLAAVRVAIETLCAENGFDRKACDDIGLCVNEAMANVIRHAYYGAMDRPMEIAADVAEDRVRITIRDWGNRVNPMDLPPKKPDPMRPGGLGLLCLKQMMTQVTFTPQPDGMLLEMVRKK